VLTKFGSVLNAVEGLSHKSPRDIRQIGNPLKSVRSECVVRHTFSYCGIRCSDLTFVPSISLLQEIFRIPAEELDRAYSEDIEALED
jgi:hypothetical protein